MKADDAKELRRLKDENTRLKRLVADLTLDNQMLKEVARKLVSPSRRLCDETIKRIHLHSRGERLRRGRSDNKARADKARADVDSCTSTDVPSRPLDRPGTSG